MQARPYRTLLCAACAAIFAMATPAMAQPAQKAVASKPSRAEMQKVQEKMQKLGTQLAAIERKAVASDTHLQAKRRHFTDHVIKVMKTLGYDPVGDTKKLAEIKQKVLSGKLSQNERAAQIKKFRSIRERLIQGQMAALRDKDVLQERKALNEATLVVMKKQNPHTGAMVKRFNALAAQLRHMAQAAAQH